MAIRFDRPVSSSARFARRFGAFALVLWAAVLLAHRFGGLATPYMVLLVLVSTGFALLAFLLAFAGLRSLWISGAEGGLDAMCMHAGIRARLEIPAGDPHHGVIEQQRCEGRRAGTVLAHHYSRKAFSSDQRPIMMSV